MPPVQEISETIEVQNQAPNPPTHTPAFPRGVASINGENDVESSNIPSTAEQCKEFINRSKQQSLPLLNNNDNDIKNYNDDDDDDCWNLTSLDWLQDRNLLRKVITNPDSSRAVGFLSASPTPSEEGKCNSSCKYIVPKRECPSDAESFEPLMPEAYHPTRHADCKPPYSYSCLIFMAIENSSEKKLPVKEIYAWIQNNFPFYKKAPSGWMNSVRHNLSLNKCFTKVEKDRGIGIGKGSYWCVDPTYKANLLHALRKTPYQPFHQMQMVSTNHASATFGTPTSSQDVKQSQSLKSLFPYVSKKAQGKHTADSSEIDVANALVSLRKSGTNLNEAHGKQQGAGNGEEECEEEDSDWVDEDVDDDEADDDDEEITTAEMVHMLKQKLGQEKVKKNLSCTPAVSIDHQYGMSDDRVRDILTRFDCFDEYCSLSSMSDDEESDEDALQSNMTPTNFANLLADVEIKQEIKEEPLSEGETRDDAQQKATIKQSGINVIAKKSLKFGFSKKTRFVSIIKKATKNAPNGKAGSGIKRKRKSSNWEECVPRKKRAAKGFDEEEQRVREGADALLELATNMIAGRSNEDVNTKDASKQEELREAMLSQTDEMNKKLNKRGRPAAKRNPRQKSSKNKDVSSDEVTNETGNTRRVDGKKRLPKDFVPNGLTSVSSTPRSFQSKRLQMRYLEQIITSAETATAEQTSTKSTKLSRGSTRNKTASRRSNDSVPENLNVDRNADDLEELDSKNWTLNFSSIDLSEVNSVELETGDMLFDEQGNKMVVLIKEEPVDELKIKEEVVDGNNGYSY